MKFKRQSQSLQVVSHFSRCVTTIGSFIISLLGTLIIFCTAALANQYTIKIQADKKLKVSGIETLIWQNNTGHPATEIPLVYSCKIKKAAIHGNPVRIKNKRLLLPEAVEAGDDISIKIEFKVNARKAYGYRMLTEAWHPKAVTYRNGKYNPDQQQADNYEVTLSAPASLIVATAGQLLEKSLTEEGRRYWHWIEILLDRYRYKYLSFDDFQAVAEEAARQKLDWFFHDWVNTNSVASYAIEDVKQREEIVSVKIRRTGTARFPIEIRLTMEDGTQTTKRILYEPDFQVLNFEDSGEPELIEIDPRGICPLLKQGKEVWKSQLPK
ncbi:MAG: hypothetical protein JXR49_21555 [Acidobacteria bacterium]|nr:hypothetical protein [Acidobacteriota bacterium]